MTFYIYCIIVLFAAIWLAMESDDGRGRPYP